MKIKEYTLTCAGCDYHAYFNYECFARTAAELHQLLGNPHYLTCTRPDHSRPMAGDHLVFTASPGKEEGLAEFHRDADGR